MSLWVKNYYRYQNNFELLFQSGGQIRHLMDIQMLLLQLGFTVQEAKIYIFLLNSQEQPASVIARKTLIPRSTTRGLLDKMCEKGFIRKLYKRNTQYYSCKEPKTLIETLNTEIKTKENHISMIKTSLPYLQNLYDNSKTIPRVQYYEGSHQVLEAFNKTLFTEGVEEILAITSYDFLQDPLIKDNDENYYIPTRIKKGITLRLIVGQTDHPWKKIGREPKYLRERRFLPEKYKPPGTFYLYGNNVLYFSTNNNENIAVNIESAVMATTMRTLFEFMWGQCE